MNLSCIKNNLLNAFLLPIIFMIPWFIVPALASAATTISFDPQERTVGVRSPFLVAVNASSKDDVNTFFVSIQVPKEFDLVGMSDGNSIINMWVDRPHMTDDHRVQFSGIIPGGFSGTEGRLALLSFISRSEGAFSIRLDPASTAYTNAIKPLSAAMSGHPLDLLVVEGRQNSVDRIPDTDAPEPFVPQLVSVPGVVDRWAAAFSAVDKGVGINRYEAFESRSRIDVDDVRSGNGFAWHTAESPYMLADQSRSSFVYIRAIDNNGNIRIGVIEPSHYSTWRLGPGSYILIVLIILVLFWYGIHKYHILLRR